jgi:hypothetical protein
MSAHPAPRATWSIRAETAGLSGLALGPNQRGKAGGEVEPSIPVMAMARQRTRRRVRRRTHPPRRGSIVPRMCRTVATQNGEVGYPKPGRLLTQQTLTLGALEARQC